MTSLSSLLLDNVGELFDLSLGSEECAELHVSDARNKVERQGKDIILSRICTIRSEQCPPDLISMTYPLLGELLGLLVL